MKLKANIPEEFLDLNREERIRFLQTEIKKQKWHKSNEILHNLHGLDKKTQTRSGREYQGWFIWILSPPETTRRQYCVSSLGAQRRFGSFCALRDAKVAVLRALWLGVSGSWSLAKFERILPKQESLRLACRAIASDPYCSVDGRD